MLSKNVIGVSKTRHQKEKKQVCMDFAYSMIKICARFAATTMVGTAIGEASIVMDCRSKWTRNFTFTIHGIVAD